MIQWNAYLIQLSARCVNPSARGLFRYLPGRLCASVNKTLNMENPVNTITASATVAGLRQAIVEHELFKGLSSPNDVAVLMQHHVFAVWDFMTLLKGLQRTLTCVELPWLPIGDPEVRYLINEIVVGEECDVDGDGKRLSHFEMYLEAMSASGADTTGINRFVQALRAGDTADRALDAMNIPASVRAFVRQTLRVVAQGKPHVMAAVFTFGREELIPDMFLSLIADLDRKFPAQLGRFRYYLERHVEVDGGLHGQLALRMVESLCGQDSHKWAEAVEAVEECLRCRIALWDGVLEELSIRSMEAAVH